MGCCLSSTRHQPTTTSAPQGRAPHEQPDPSSSRANIIGVIPSPAVQPSAASSTRLSTEPPQLSQSHNVSGHGHLGLNFGFGRADTGDTSARSGAHEGELELHATHSEQGHEAGTPQQLQRPSTPNRPLRSPRAEELHLPSRPTTRPPPGTSTVTSPTTPRSQFHTPLESLEASSQQNRAGAQWPLSRLHEERAAYFDTRVSGRSEVWASLRLVAEFLDNGEVAQAQGVLDASGCTCPTGEVWRGVFDERGALYKVPVWCIGIPPEVTQDVKAEESASKKGAEDDEEATVVGVEKGKGKDVESVTETEMPVTTPTVTNPDKEGKQVKIRARLSDRAKDVVVRGASGESVASIIAKVKNSAGLPPTARIRFAYMGKILDETSALDDSGWHPGHVVNALVLST